MTKEVFIIVFVSDVHSIVHNDLLGPRRASAALFSKNFKRLKMQVDITILENGQDKNDINVKICAEYRKILFAFVELFARHPHLETLITEAVELKNKASKSAQNN